MALFNYECDEVKRIIEEVSPNYPQLTTYEKEWLYFHKNGYIPGIPVELEYETVNVNPIGMVSNAIPYQYKSAIIKGNTLVNINRPITRNDSMKVENGLQILTTWTTAYNLWMVNDITLFKTNTKYYIIAEVIDNTLTSTWNPMIGSTNCVFSGSISSLNFASKETGIKCAIFTTKSDFTNVSCGLRSATGTNETVGSILKFRVAIIEYQDGMENWDIPYFEGMKSVQMPVLTISGKNLFNVELEQGSVNTNTGTLIETTGAIRSKDFIKLSSNENFTISKTNGTQIITIAIYDKNYKFVRALWERTFTLKGDELYIKFADTENDLNNQYQIEKGKTPSSYEPYKSNILTVNEDLTLRSNGDVCDELNLLTGRLTQRIDENNEVLAQAVVKTVDLTKIDKPYEGVNNYYLTANIPCEAVLEVPVVSTGKQTLKEIND